MSSLGWFDDDQDILPFGKIFLAARDADIDLLPPVRQRVQSDAYADRPIRFLQRQGLKKHRAFSTEQDEQATLRPLLSLTT
jgi:hypothetical protein